MKATQAYQEDWLAAERLHRAAAAGNLERARELIREGAPLNAFDAIGYTPLHHAVRNARFEMVRLLLDAGADINARDVATGADSAVQVAVAQASPRMVEFLLHFGADDPSCLST
ncbi:MAG TPA: ankyrin repeat domain-containing protein [Burkholderiales bacterium]|nr:ankyrin repeat domain-containing protein [Burkholderiales bacterium]